MPQLRKKYEGVKGKIVSFVAVSMSLYHILYISHAFEKLDIYIAAAPHAAASLGFVLILVFLLLPGSKKAPRDRLLWYDAVLSVLAASGTGYFFFMSKQMILRNALPEIGTVDLIVGSVTILLLLEASRRVIGLSLPIIAVLFIVETMFSDYVPGFFQGRGFSWGAIVKQLYIWDGGLFGIPMYIAATIVISFVMLASFLQLSGAGKFILDVAFSLFGRFRGGPAKVAVIGSAFFGTISGSTTGNAASTGTITIPMMKQVGYKPHVAAAIEAVASNGGQVMPPVMGAVAFIMCEFLQTSYISVCIAALLPAILYFLGLLLMVHFEALKQGIKGIPSHKLPSFRRTLRNGWYYILPLLVLLYFLAVLEYTPTLAAFYALGSLLVISLVVHRGSISAIGRMVLKGLDSTGRAMLEVGTACGTAGIIIGCVGLSGLGQKLSMGLLSLSGGNLHVLLILTALASFVLGMGMTSIPVYIMLVILVAPALIHSGVLPIAAHLFVFYWGLVSFITPPVCIDAFVTAAIAGSRPYQTGWQASRLAIVVYIIPFMFVYGPALLLRGTPIAVAQAIVTSIIGVAALAAGVSGYALGPIKWIERSLLILAALLTMFVGQKSDLVGFGIIAIVVMRHLNWTQIFAFYRKDKPVLMSENAETARGVSEIQSGKKGEVLRSREF
jgi:TRAP transporter 4TM/12TM fusion protein